MKDDRSNTEGIYICDQVLPYYIYITVMILPSRRMLKVNLGIFLSIISVAFSSHGQGISFLSGSYQSAVETARRTNKPLFVEVYLNGCPHCAALAPVLQEKQVGDFFNARFVSYKVEANSEESKQMQQQKGITYTEFPLFFFFDPVSGQLVHQAAPAERPNRSQMIDEVLLHGRDALDSNQRTSGYANRFAKGDRNLQYLVNYAKYAKSTKDTERLWVLNNEIAKAFTKPSDLESESGFYVISRLINDFKNPMAVHFFNNLAKYKAKFPAKEVKDAGESILYYTLYFGKRMNDLNSDEIIKIRQAFVNLGVTPQLASGRTIVKELEAHLREKNTKKAVLRFDEYRKSTTLTLGDYAFLVTYFREKANDASYVPSVTQWVNDGLKLVKPNERNTKQVADLYLEQSKAQLKLGKKAEAKKAAENALAVAKAAKIDTKPYANEVSMIK